MRLTKISGFISICVFFQLSINCSALGLDSEESDNTGLLALLALAAAQSGSSAPVDPCPSNAYSFSQTLGTGGTGGTLNAPQAVITNNAGQVYVADMDNEHVKRFSSTGVFELEIATSGGSPRGVSLNASENVIIAENSNQRVRVVTPAGVQLSTFPMTTFDLYAVNRDAAGDIFLTEAGTGVNRRAQKWRITSATTATLLFSIGSGAGTGNGQFNTTPFGIVVDSSGNIYIPSDNRVQKFDSNGSFLMSWGSNGTGAGQFTKAQGIAIDTFGYIYVTNNQGASARVQKFTSAGVYLGQIGSPGAGNGQFQEPTAVAVDREGAVYVVDATQNRLHKFACVR